jgi:enoyl-CoA hydratase/carnithine racemase
MLDVYGWRLKGGAEAIARLMDATTWLDPAEAVRCGLADQVGPASAGITARFDATAVAMLGEIPPRFRDLIAQLRDPRRALAPLATTELYARRDAERKASLIDVTEIYRRLNTPFQGGRL